MLYNPTSALSSWIHEQWFEDGRPRQDRLDDTVFLHSTYLDNLDNLNAKSIEGYERLKKSNPTYYRNTILAEWTLEASERIYAGWDLLSKMDEVGDVWYGMDFGYGGKDHTAITKINWIDGKYYCTEILSLPKLSIRSTLTAMRKAGIPFNARIFADSAIVVDTVEPYVAGLWYHHLTWQRTKGELKNHEPDILASLRYGILSKRPTRHPSGLPKRPAKRKIGYQGSSGSSFTGSGGSGFI